MKKFIILAVCFMTCRNTTENVRAQVVKEYKATWTDINNSKIQLSKNVREVKKIVHDKVFPLPEIIHDTLYIQFDTCTTNLYHDDSVKVYEAYLKTLHSQKVVNAKKPSGVGKVIRKIGGIFN